MESMIGLQSAAIVKLSSRKGRTLLLDWAVCVRFPDFVLFGFSLIGTGKCIV